MESTQEDFIKFINAICNRPRMFVRTGVYNEIAAFILGYTYDRETPISNRTFERYVCLKNFFPTNYSWTYAIEASSINDEEAIKTLKETILEFIEFRTNMTDDELEEYAISCANELFRQEGEAEKVFRIFDSAILDGNKDVIEPIIKDNPDAKILWSGAYPSDVSRLLQELSSNQPIRRISESDGGKTIKLLTSGWPFPIEMRNIDGNWIVNADQIIQIRIDINNNVHNIELRSPHAFY